MPPQGCRSTSDPHQPHPAHAHRWLDVHRLDQPGIGRELLIGDPLGGHRQVARHEVVQLRLDLGRIRHFGQVEIHPALVLAHRRPGDRVGQHHRHEMQRGVHPHQLQSPRPVEFQGDRLADPQWRRIRRQLMQDRGLVAIGVDGAGHHYGRAIRAHNPAGVAGLAARGCIKDRPVKGHAGIADRRHYSRCRGQIGIVTKQERCHAAGSGSTTDCQSSGARSSSQCGTGRFFARRNSGLNSFD